MTTEQRVPTVGIADDVRHLNLPKEQLQQMFGEQLRHLHEAEDDGPPATLQVGQVLRGDFYGYQITQMVKTLSDSGFVLLWETRTGMPSPIAKNLFTQAITRRWPDGAAVYSIKPPTDAEGNFLINRTGTYPCLLNSAHADFETHKGYGAVPQQGPCPKVLDTLMDCDSHMEHVHPAEMRIIRREQDILEREEEREFRRMFREVTQENQGQTTELLRQFLEFMKGGGIADHPVARPT